MRVRLLLRVLAAQARMNALLFLKSPALIATWMVSDLVLDAGAIAAAFLIAARFDGIAGWTRTEVVFLLAYATVVVGLRMSLFGYNVADVSRRVGRGQLDHTLVKPMPLWAGLLTEGFSPLEGSVRVLPATALLAWSAHRLHFGWTRLLAIAACVLASTAAHVAFGYLVGALAFWAPRGAEEISSSWNGLVWTLKGFPLDPAGTVVRGLLTVALPVGLVAWLPARSIVRGEASGIAWSLALAALLVALAALAFGKGVRRYERVGSQRYSAWGHRS